MAARTRAQGRPMGSLIAWLHEDCGGDPAVHNARWSGLPYETRVNFRNEYATDEEMKPFFDQERDPWDDEPDGEPRVPP